MRVIANIRPFVLAIAALHAAPSSAQESRGFNPIARPQAKATLPDGAIPVNPPLPVSRARVEAAIAKVTQAWGERKLDGILSTGFSDRQRLIDALETKVPRDAKLRVVSIQGWQVLEQHRIGGMFTSKLNVTVASQVEFSDPASGYQVRPGTQDFVITLNHPPGP
ncbi:MAG: hypothetical protein JNM76_02125 [Betaproteobacteria bacterium]|nr:hypothetical protein [Betaproteobacteria bacterium]